MPSKKKTTKKKVTIKDLPKAKKSVTAEEAKSVKGGSTLVQGGLSKNHNETLVREV